MISGSGSILPRFFVSAITASCIFFLLDFAINSISVSAARHEHEHERRLPLGCIGHAMRTALYCLSIVWLRSVRFGSVRFGSVQQLNFICRRRRQIGYFCSSLGYLSALSLRSLSLSAHSVALDLDEAIVFSRVGFMNLDVDAYNRRGCFLRFEPWSHAAPGTTRRFLAESIQ
jgi:hypothetical protein